MEMMYEFVGKKDTVDMLRESFQRSLERRGYDCEIGVTGPMAPWLFEYRKEGDEIVTLTVDDSVGEKWESAVRLETEEMSDDVVAVVSDAVLKLLADLSTRLIESVADAETRARIVEELTGVIATLK